MSAPPQDTAQNNGHDDAHSWSAPAARGEDAHMEHSGYNAGGDQSYDNAPTQEDNYGPINVKEDG